MARGENAAQSSPAAPPTLKKSTSSSQSMKNQSSIQSFFSKKAPSINPAHGTPNIGQASASNGIPHRNPKSAPNRGSSQSLTPAPSSDALEPPSSPSDEIKIKKEPTGHGLPSPVTPANGDVPSEEASETIVYSSPSRKVCAQNFSARMAGMLTKVDYIEQEGCKLCRVG